VADDQQLQQQKMMLYAMPVFLTFLGFNLPVGVLVYWVTTNLWQMGQQWFMLREVEHTTPPAKPSKKPATSKETKKPATSKETKKSTTSKKDTRNAADKADGRRKKGGPSGGSKKAKTKSTGVGRRDSASKNGANRNGHQAGGPKKVSKQQDETGDKRR
jgi:YidC/Oxa1 family membrane protein insertase